MSQSLQTDANLALEQSLQLCQERVGYHFQNLSLLKSALTHSSGAPFRLASNERLEFLGDSILGAIVCEYLFHNYPQSLEGELTKIKSVVVSRQTCAKISKRLGLEDFLILGKGMSTHPHLPKSLLSDVFESLVAAVYLDAGLETARKFVLKQVQPEIEAAVEGNHGGNYKSQLQQFAQREFGTTPIYQLLDEKGPDHSKCFKISVQVGYHQYQAAWGRNKKEAEQRAALNALNALTGESDTYPVE